MKGFAGILIVGLCVLAAYAPSARGQDEAQLIQGGFVFLEGPVWDARNGRLIFSDLRTRRIYSYTPGSKAVTLFESSNKANGHVLLPDGSLISCEHLTHCIALRQADGTRTVLADEFEEHPLNSPNDLVMKSDGSIWFTDPDYGLGHRDKEQAHNNVFVFDRMTKDLRAVASDFEKPNGLCFSPDEKLLYIADAGSPHHIRVFDVTTGNALVNGRVFAEIKPGAPDGIRCDASGNVWSSAGDGVHVFNPDGQQIRVIPVPEKPSNLCFGGESNATLFITARTGLYAIQIK